MMALDDVVLIRNFNLLAHYCLWQESGRIHLLTEYCEGGDMRKRFLENRDRFFSEDFVRRCLMQVANGLKDLHACKLIHLDIKPENIYVTAGTLKIGDFGSCLKWDEWDHHDGDPKYMAPELLILEKGGLNSGAPDIFSLGVVMCELVLSDFPSTHVGNEDFFTSLRQGIVSFDGPLRLQAPISPQLANLIQAMIDPYPHNRPSAAQMLEYEILRNIRPSLSRDLVSDRRQSRRHL